MDLGRRIRQNSELGDAAKRRGQGRRGIRRDLIRQHRHQAVAAHAVMAIEEGEDTSVGSLLVRPTATSTAGACPLSDAVSFTLFPPARFVADRLSKLSARGKRRELQFYAY